MMQFIILGYVPGTDIQIGFDTIMRAIAVIALFYLLTLEIKENKKATQKLTDLINAISL